MRQTQHLRCINEDSPGEACLQTGARQRADVIYNNSYFSDLWESARIGVIMDNMPISVIVVAKNAERTIEDCLDSVRRNNPAEIIVVDSNSSDKTVEIAKRYTEKIYSDGGKGKSYARQLGAEQATLEYIAYVDADVVLTEGALTTMATELQGSEYASVRAQLLAASVSTYWERATEQHRQLSPRRFGIGTAACLFRRDILLKYGFELSYGGYLDDQDLEYRLRREGYKFGISSALAYHRERASLQSLAKQRFLYGRLAPHYIWKHGPWHAGFWPPLVTLYWLAICLIKGKPKLIPYFILDGIVQTAGMAKGFFELISEASRRRRQKDAG